MTIPSRRQHVTEKIPGELTGLRASIFVHVDYIERAGHREIVELRISEKKKDGATLDTVFAAVSKAFTTIIREVINAPTPTNVIDINTGKDGQNET